MARNLSNLRILLTGASRGIGRCTALELASHGATLALVARSSHELEAVAAEVRAKGGTAETFLADLTSPEQRETLMRDVVGKLGGLDVLLNIAGVASFGEFSTSSEEVLRKIMEINFFAPVELIRLALPHLTLSDRRPAIVNISSICGKRGIPSWPEHCASKFALSGLTEAMRAEFARFEVDVIHVVPGLVKTDDQDKHLLRNCGKIDMNFEGAQSPEHVARKIVIALQKNKTETVIGVTAWWLNRGNRAMPRLIDWVLNRRVAAFLRKQK